MFDYIKTVGDLKDFLAHLNDDMPVIINAWDAYNDAPMVLDDFKAEVVGETLELN